MNIPGPIRRADPIYDGRWTGPVYASRLRRLFKWAPPAGRRVLDAGCGFGPIVYLAGARGARPPVIGLNLDLRQLGRAREIFRGLGAAWAAWVGADMKELPFSSGSFDVVYATDCLEHVRNLQPVLEELRRVLRPQGILAVSLPMENWLYDLGRNLCGEGRKPHDHYWEAPRIEEKLRRLFSVRRAGYAPGLWLPLYRLLVLRKA